MSDAAQAGSERMECEGPDIVGAAPVRRGNRLSVMPVSGDEWEYILAME